MIDTKSRKSCMLMYFPRFHLPLLFPEFLYLFFVFVLFFPESEGAGGQSVRHAGRTPWPRQLRSSDRQLRQTRQIVGFVVTSSTARAEPAARVPWECDPLRLIRKRSARCHGVGQSREEPGLSRQEASGGAFASRDGMGEGAEDGERPTRKQPRAREHRRPPEGGRTFGR